jgi:glycosyltransferase involved in cell wall biosynthesis
MLPELMAIKSTKVAILMCTYNGEPFLKEQLDSLIAQDISDWHLWVSDDGSKDKTWAILESYQSKMNGRLSIIKGPKKGFARNFLSLICMKDIKAEYYAYSDQDDIWHSDKLSAALQWLETIPKGTPALYGARSMWINEAGQELGLSNLFIGPFSFKNALVQNVAAGNTMVFNQAACNLIREAGNDIDVIFHDWWTYIVVSGCGGEIFIDKAPRLDYRQHDNNVIGCNNGFHAKVIRLKRLLSGHMRYWNTRHVVALQKIIHRLTSENRYILDLFANAREDSLLPRLIGIKRSGIYRQTALGNIAIIIAAFLRKL